MDVLGLLGFPCRAGQLPCVAATPGTYSRIEVLAERGASMRKERLQPEIHGPEQRFVPRTQARTTSPPGNCLILVRFLLALFPVTLLAPPITLWIWLDQQRILRNGRTLSERETVSAKAIGVKNAAAIRVLVLESVPMPEPRWTHRFAQHLGFPTLTAAGMSLEKGIYLQRKFQDRPVLLAHECVHAAQYERHGIFGFLRRYLFQCVRDGYVNAAFEREAVEHVCRR